MLQRIQTVWLIVAAFAAFLALKFSFYIGTTPDLIPGFKVNGTTNLGLMALTILTGTISAICIFLYKNRTLQFRLVLLAILLQAGLIYLYFKTIHDYINGTFSLTAILQPVVVVALILAAKGIRNDSRILKESNRLR